MFGKYEGVPRGKVADSDTSVCVILCAGFVRVHIVHMPGLFPRVRNNNRSNYKLSKQSCGWSIGSGHQRQSKDEWDTTVIHRFFHTLSANIDVSLSSLSSLPPSCLFFPFLSLHISRHLLHIPFSLSLSLSLSLCLSVRRSNRHSGSPGCSRGGSLTNGELNEEQIAGSGSSGRRRSSKSHGSPGSSAGIQKVC